MRHRTVCCILAPFIPCIVVLYVFGRAGADQPAAHRSTWTNRYVEVLVVADYDVYENHKRYLNTDDTAKIVRHMKMYYALVVSEIDLIFQQAFRDNSDLNIHIRLTGYVINTAQNVEWMDLANVEVPNSPTNDGRRTAVVATVVPLLQTWITNKRYTLPAYDHLLAFTGRDLYGSSGFKTGGWTNFSQLCHESALSLIEDFGGFQVVRMAVRELCMSFGIPFDGDTSDPVAQSCLASDQYLMAPSFKDSLSLQNSLTFSTCSKQKFKNLVSSSSDTPWQEPLACLLNPAENDAEAAWWLKYYPGQLYDVNQQCAQVHGPFSVACLLKQENIDTMCNILQCSFSPPNGTCIVNSQWGAATGTPCGDGKWCELGRCVPNSSAPKGDCFAGDVGCYVVNHFYTCPELVRSFTEQPSLVCSKDAWVRESCCKTCNITGGNDPSLVPWLLSRKCASAPCKNYGTCSENETGYNCNCDSGYTGRNCENMKVSNCNPNPYCMVEHGGSGRCIDDENNPPPRNDPRSGCFCFAGWTGPNCSTPIQDVCSSMPCFHGVPCTNPLSTYTCNGLTGSRCEFPVSVQRTSKQCSNGGTFSMDASGEIRCVCQSGFYGLFCDKSIYSCATNVCTSNAHCFSAGIYTWLLLCIWYISGGSAQIINGAKCQL